MCESESERGQKCHLANNFTPSKLRGNWVARRYGWDIPFPAQLCPSTQIILPFSSVQVTCWFLTYFRNCKYCSLSDFGPFRSGCLLNVFTISLVDLSVYGRNLYLKWFRWWHFGSDNKSINFFSLKILKTKRKHNIFFCFSFRFIALSRFYELLRMPKFSRTTIA